MWLATCDFAVFAACSELTRKFLKLPWRTSSFAFCWLTRILMSKNVNIYVSRDPPIVINNVSCLFYWLLRRSNGISLAKNLTTRITPLPCIITVQNQNAIRNVFYCPKKWTKQLKKFSLEKDANRFKDIRLCRQWNSVFAEGAPLQSRLLALYQKE